MDQILEMPFSQKESIQVVDQPDASAVTPPEQPVKAKDDGSGLTKADVAEIVRQALVEDRKSRQSSQDKFEARIRKEIDARVAVLRESGIQPTQEQIAVIDRKTRDQISAETPETGEQDEPIIDPKIVQFTNNAAEMMMQKLGVNFDKDDPEIKEIVVADKSGRPVPPEEYLASLLTAVVKKQVRMAGTAAAPPKPTPLPPPVNSGGRSDGIRNDLPPSEYFKRGYKTR